ncbi:WD40-repeat-containing domain protein [Syncephalis plumigaleata]|nr:WD40-repeat-containing domain protein [Syncephalis plumigaleata]
MLHAQSHMHKSSISENGPATYTLPGVLHFLQQEWRRFERERNEWEIERKGTCLEGECRSQENIKVDLIRRIKMLEHIVRLERVKQQQKLDTTSATNSSQQEDGQDTTKTASPTTGAESLALTRDPTVLPLLQATTEKSNTGENGSTVNVAKGTSAKPVSSNQKMRIKSRDVLKFCLQEVDQLSSFCTEQLATATSAVSSVNITGMPWDDFIRKVHTSSGLTGRTEYGTNNPGQNRNRTRGDGSTNEETSPTLPPVDSPPTVRLPRSPPMHNQRRARRPSNPTPDDQPGIRSPPQPGRKRQTVFIPADVDVMTEGAIPPADNHSIVAQTPRSPILTGVKVDEVDDENMLDTDNATSELASQDSTQSTDDSLQHTDHTTNMEDRSDSQKASSRASDYFDYDDVDEMASLNQTMINGTKDDEDRKLLWQQFTVLQSHLDTVRAIDFHSTELILASGSEDGLVKIWNLTDPSSNSPRPMEYEPRATMRGHQGAVNAVQISSSQNKCFSAGADTAIMVWNMPGNQSELYSPHDATVLRAQYIGHSDIIWDLRLQPIQMSRTHETSPLRSSFSYEGVESGDQDLTRDITPISVDFYRPNSQQMIVGYGNGALRLFDMETGQLVVECVFLVRVVNGSPNTQINRIVAHPSSSLVIAAMKINIYVFSILLQATHKDALSSVDIHSTGTTFVTGSHDGQVKLWDTRNFHCIQEVTTHRRKLDEGVLQVHSMKHNHG